MSTFTVAISCLTASNLPWFMDLTFEVPIQYCSLQHRTLLLSPGTFTAGCCFCFGSISSFFLELLTHWSPVAYWAPTNLGSSSSSVLSFCIFILFMWVLKAGILKWFPIPSSSGPHIVRTLHHDLSKKAREFQKKHLFLLYWLCQSLWLCGSQQAGNNLKDGNTRPLDLPLEKSVCRSGSKS